MHRFLPILLVLLGGCAVRPPPPEIPRAAMVAGSAPAVAARVLAALRASGLAPQPNADGFLAETRAGADPAWADCRLVLVRDHDERVVRSDWAEPEARLATLKAIVQPGPEGTLVMVTGQYGATYTDRYRNLPFTAPCRSNGVLERALLDAARG